MTPEIIPSDVVNEKSDDQSDWNQFSLETNCDHHYHWQTEQHIHQLKDLIMTHLLNDVIDNDSHSWTGNRIE